MKSFIARSGIGVVVRGRWGSFLWVVGGHNEARLGARVSFIVCGYGAPNVEYC